MKRRTYRSAAALIAVALVSVTACGSDSDNESASTTVEVAESAPSTDAVSPTEVPSTEVPASEVPTSDGGTTPPSAGVCDPASIDSSLDETFGTGAGYMQYMLLCAKDSPLEASGEPVVLSLQNTEGDPAASFPQITEAMIAGVEYINTELGGIGADLANGTPGRPIQLETCKMALNPADSVSCANELAAKKPVIAFHGLSFFTQSAYPIYEAAGSVNDVLLPNAPADFTARGVFAAGPSGGCVSAHPAIVDFIVNDLLKDKPDAHVAVPYFDSPTSIACYTDLTKKVIEVLAGTADGPSEFKGTHPELTYTGVPVTPGTADMTAVATQILDSNPDAIMYSSSAADCMNLIDALSGVGWSAEETPLVMSGACFDITRLMDAGDNAKGVYFINEGTITTRPDMYEGLKALEPQTYLDAMEKYSPETALTGFGSTGFQSLMFAYDVLNELARDGQEPDAENFSKALAATTDRHYFASNTIGCANAVAPYVNICHTSESVAMWDGANLVPSKEDFSALAIIAGTEIKLD